MSPLTSVVFGCFFILFSYLMVNARSRRQVLALTLIGALAVALAIPPRAEAQSSLFSVIQSVLGAINGPIKTALNSINSVRTAISNLYQQVTWPVSLINQAKALVKQTVSQYRNPMQKIFNLNLKSATLPNSAALEKIMRNRQIDDFSGLSAAYVNAYGTVPNAQSVSPIDRAMVDMDDALALGNLKTLKETDAAVDLTLQTANEIEDGAGEAAPGSAPFLTASAVVASVESQALTQKMLAAELRQEAARLAHDNALRKRGAAITGDVNNQILNLLQRK
jgi:hypothetical protein